MSHILGVLIYYFFAAQQTSTVKLPVYFLKFLKRTRELGVDDISIKFYSACSFKKHVSQTHLREMSSSSRNQPIDLPCKWIRLV